jgi:uncharacterized membrane protein
MGRALGIGLGAIAVILSSLSSWRLYALSAEHPEAAGGFKLMALGGVLLTALLAAVTAWWIVGRRL